MGISPTRAPPRQGPGLPAQSRLMEALPLAGVRVTLALCHGAAGACPAWPAEGAVMPRRHFPASSCRLSARRVGLYRAGCAVQHPSSFQGSISQP